MLNLDDIERTADAGLRHDKPVSVSGSELKHLVGIAAALKNIAGQNTVEELTTNGDYDDADIEGGYDALIHIARRAMQEG